MTTLSKERSRLAPMTAGQLRAEYARLFGGEIAGNNGARGRQASAARDCAGVRAALHRPGSLLFDGVKELLTSEEERLAGDRRRGVDGIFELVDRQNFGFVARGEDYGRAPAVDALMLKLSYWWS